MPINKKKVRAVTRKGIYSSSGIFLGASMEWTAQQRILKREA